MSWKPRRWTEGQKQAIWNRLDAGEPDGSLAILYFHSSVRLQRHPPAMASMPQMLPRWKPTKS